MTKSKAWFLIVVGAAVAAACSGEIDDGGGLVAAPSTEKLEAKEGDGVQFLIDVPAGVKFAKFQIEGGTGDADLLLHYEGIRKASTPQKRARKEFEHAAVSDGNAETIVLKSPKAGTWRVLVYGKREFKDVTFRLAFDEAEPAPPADTQPPTVRVVRPAAGERAAVGSEYVVDCAADDTGSGIKSVTMTFGAESYTCTPNGAQGVRCARGFNVTANLAGTSVRVTCTALDMSGNGAEAAVAALQVDALPPSAPTVVIHKPAINQVRAGSQATVACLAKSADDRVRDVTIWFDGAAVQRCAIGESISASPQLDCFTLVSIPPSRVGTSALVECQASDTRGLVSARAAWSVAIIASADVTAPTASLASLGSSIAGPGNYEFTCTGYEANGASETGLDHIEIIVNRGRSNQEHHLTCGSLNGVSSKSCSRTLYLGADLRGLTIPYECRACDRAGNCGTAYRQVTMANVLPPPPPADTRGPDITIVAPGPGYATPAASALYNFTCSALDSASGLSSIEIIVDDSYGRIPGDGHHLLCSNLGGRTFHECIKPLYIGNDLANAILSVNCRARDTKGNLSSTWASTNVRPR